MSIRPLDIPTPDGTIDAKLYQPEGEGSWPAVILIPDFGGPRPAYDAMGNRLAAAGYSVLIPHSFYREGRAPLKQIQGGNFGDESFRKLAMGLIGSLTPERVKMDIGAELEALSHQAHVKPGPVGIVGYCMGGAIALRAAAAFPDRIAAAASYHGGNLVTEGPHSPHRLLGQTRGELYFGHADQDPFMDAAAIAQFEAAIRESGAKAQSELYVGARHGFAVEGSPVYDQAASERHWSTMLALFERTLKKA